MADRKKSSFIIKPKRKVKKRRKKKVVSPKRAAYLKVKKEYNSPAYKQWRIKVFERDRYTCQMCGQKGGQLECHHIRPKYKFPELMLVIDNGCTLCRYCHRSIVTRKEEKFYYIFDRIVKLNKSGK